MEESILKFAQQFNYQSEIINAEKLGANFGADRTGADENKYKNFVLAGMGGSHLAAGILRAYKPSVNLYIHRDYGTPDYDEEFCRETLFIASSYSGNTEEVVDFLDEAYSKGYDILVIATGGKLIDFAKQNELAHIQIPDTGIQPRLALGFSTIALASVVLPEVLDELHSMQKVLSEESVQALRNEGEELAKSLDKKMPIIYTSNQNRAIGYNWKIKMNETGKIPAFANTFPELNHNEMQGYDFVDENKLISENTHFIIIQDSTDNPRVIKRMEVVEALLQEKGYPVTRLYLNGETRFERIFKSLILADWTALSLAQKYNTEPEQVPLIEEFKKRILDGK